MRVKSWVSFGTTSELELLTENTEYIVSWPSEVVHLYAGFPTLGWDGAKKP